MKEFQELKSALINPPVFQNPDLSKNKEFLLQTDASGIPMGWVHNRDGRPVAYASRSLNKAEKNYPTIEKIKIPLIVWSIKYFRPYLCRILSIKVVCIIQVDNNAEFTAGIVNEIKASTKWSGLKSVQRINKEDDKLVIRNDFHLLPD